MEPADPLARRPVAVAVDVALDRAAPDEGHPVASVTRTQAVLGPA